MCDVDLDRPDVFRQQVRRARKPRRCCECWTAIPAGDRYLYVFGVWDGSPDAFGMHTDCAGLRQWVEKYICGDVGEIPFGGLREEIQCAGPDGEDLLEVFQAIRSKYGDAERE